MLMRSSRWAWECVGVREGRWRYPEKATYTVGKIPLDTTLSDEPAEVPFTSKGMMKRKKKKGMMKRFISLWDLNVGR